MGEGGLGLSGVTQTAKFCFSPAQACISVSSEQFQFHFSPRKESQTLLCARKQMPVWAQAMQGGGSGGGRGWRRGSCVIIGSVRRRKPRKAGGLAWKRRRGRSRTRPCP